MRVPLMALACAGLALAAPASKGWESVGQIQPGTRVEVVTADRGEVGEFVGSSTESLTIRTPVGERKFLRTDVQRVVSRGESHRVRNMLIGVGVGAGVGLLVDQTLGRYLRNESNPSDARPVMWGVPIAVCGGIGALVPGYRVVYRK